MTDALVPQQESSLSLGQTALRPQDLVFPRIKIVQQMSAEASSDEDPVKPGSYYNVLTGEDYGNRFTAIPILPFMQRILLVRSERRGDIEDNLGTPLSAGDGLKCRSFDMVHGQGEPGILCEQCPLSAWRGNEPPHCTETYNVAATNELGELIILSFSKSGAKVGKQLFSSIRLSGKAAWAFVYELRTERKQNEQGIFYVPVVKRIGQADPELQQAALVWARQLNGVVIDVTPVDEEAEATGASDDDGSVPWDDEVPTPEPPPATEPEPEPKTRSRR